MGFQLAGATGVARRRGLACNQHLQPTEIPALYIRRIRRDDVFGWAARCGPGINAMIGENRWLVTDEPAEVQDYCRKIADHFRGIYKI